MDTENASETDDLLKAPMRLSVLALLTFCAIFILFIIFSYVGIFDGLELISGLLGLLALIGLLTTAMAINARRRGSAMQKKVANRYIAVGIIGMIAGVGLLLLFIIYTFSMIA
jgi:hypothetical protein